jgi:hypothetical protein
LERRKAAGFAAFQAAASRDCTVDNEYDAPVICLSPPLLDFAPCSILIGFPPTSRSNNDAL